MQESHLHKVDEVYLNEFQEDIKKLQLLLAAMISAEKIRKTKQIKLEYSRLTVINIETAGMPNYI